MALDVERVREIAERVAASSGLEVVEIEFLGSGTVRMQFFFGQTCGGKCSAVGRQHEDCANFSREFGTILDVEDVMPGSYTLEVSSRGLDPEVDQARGLQSLHG